MTPARMAEIHRQCFSIPRPWREDEFTALLQGAEVVLVASDEGFLLGRVVADEAEVMTLAVLPAARRRGLGRELLSRFEGIIRDRGVQRVFLEVAEQNHPALALYAQAGYARAGFRRDYYQGPGGKKVSALVLSRKFRQSETPSGAQNRSSSPR